MDLVYMSEAMAYQSIRGPVYDRYEYHQQWPNCHQVRSERPSVSNNHSSSSEKCMICKEKQRRVLGLYIRKKSIGGSVHSKIIEEEEDKCCSSSN